MSEISSAASASASTSSGTATHRSGHGGTRQGSATLFANLLSMAGAGRQQPLADGLSTASTDSTDTAGDDAGDNPLSSLLGWMDQTQEGGPWFPMPSDGDAAGRQAASPFANNPPGMGVPLQGLALASAAATAAAAAPSLAATGPATARAETSPIAGAGAATGHLAGPGIDITGMRPVAPGTTLTPEEAASLTVKHAGPGATTSEAVRSPGMEAGGARATVPLQSAATPSMPLAGTATPAATEDVGSIRLRATAHNPRNSAVAGSSTAQPTSSQSATAPATAAAGNATGIPGPIPAPNSAAASPRPAPAAQDRAGKSTPSERSTVALDERFARAQAEAATVRDRHTEARSSLATDLAGADTPPQNRNDLAPPVSAAPAAHSTRAADAGAPDPAGLPPDAEPTSVSHWSTQHLRHASLRVGEGSQEAIDIQLSMDGQELNVDFRTDSAEARATLSQQADQSLGSLLERSGIQLGGVSVGAQHQHGQQPPRQTPPAPPAASNATGTGQDSGPLAPGAAPRGQLAARQDSSRPLDLFV